MERYVGISSICWQQSILAMSTAPVSTMTSLPGICAVIFRVDGRERIQKANSSYCKGCRRLRPNKALHRTLANVAKIHEYNRLFRVVEDVLDLVERR